MPLHNRAWGSRRFRLESEFPGPLPPLKGKCYGLIEAKAMWLNHAGPQDTRTEVLLILCSGESLALTPML